MKVGYLGPKGTFSYEICKKSYDDYIEKIPYKTIKETILALDDDEVDEVIVPVENSLQGCVTETLDVLTQNRSINIKSEKILKIKQNLMANDFYDLDKIKEVYSHPQAIAQCRNYIENSLKNATIVEVSSTALAAKEVINKPHSACIGSIDCKDEYNLKLLEKDIQDNHFNETRFWILGKNLPEVSNAKQLTMIFTTANKPGALYKALSIFDKYNLNLTKIESRPAKTKLGEYYFWIDIEIDGKNYIPAISELEEIVGFYRILGEY